MEVRRLLTALHSISHDFKTLQIQELLTALTTAVQNVSASPADAAANEAFYKAADTLREVLPRATTNLAASSVRLALREAGLESLMGSRLRIQLDQILGATPFLLPRAAQAIQALDKQVRSDVKKLDSAIAALESLNFEPEDIAPSEYEIGVLMPSSVTKDDLRIIYKELDEWVFVIDRIQELVDGQPSPSIPIRSMSSGSLDVFCSFHATGAEAFLLLSLGVYQIFQWVRDAQRRRTEMEELRYPETVIEGLRQHEKDLIDKGKAEIVKKLMAKKSPQLAANRDGEMETALQQVVTFVLRRINQGVDVEVSLPPDAVEARAEAEADVRQLQQQIEVMRLEMSKIANSLPDRSSPILQLPDLPAEELPHAESRAHTPKHPPRQTKKKD